MAGSIEKMLDGFGLLIRKDFFTQNIMGGYIIISFTKEGFSIGMIGESGYYQVNYLSLVRTYIALILVCFPKQF